MRRKTLTGKVEEADTGMPVPEAIILENGVMSNFDGGYSIEIPKETTLMVTI